MPHFGRGEASTHNWKGVRSQSEVDMCTSKQEQARATRKRQRADKQQQDKQDK